MCGGMDGPDVSTILDLNPDRGREEPHRSLLRCSHACLPRTQTSGEIRGEDSGEEDKETERQKAEGQG